MTIHEIGGGRRFTSTPFGGGSRWEKIGDGSYHISAMFTDEMSNMMKILQPYQIGNLIYYYAKDSRLSEDDGCGGCPLANAECRRLSKFNGETTAEGLTDERKTLAHCRKRKVLDIDNRLES